MELYKCTIPWHALTGMHFCVHKYFYLFNIKILNYSLVLQHLRVEENPILQMSHLEAASILLVGPTLKKFNDRGMF